MAIDNPPFPVRRGDDRLLIIVVDEQDDLTGFKIRLTYGLSAGGVALVTKTEADLSVSGGTITYRMRPAETLALEALRTYWWQCKIKFPDNSGEFRDTVAEGSFFVEPSQGE